MTIYEYSCLNCHAHFEWKRNYDVRRKKCPKCKLKKLARIWTVAGIHFKGTGYTQKIR
jgi:putative FmdB family regulatory protein